MRKVLVAVAIAAFANLAFAQGAARYPEKEVRVIVPVAPGGPTDLAARVLADRLRTKWGKPFVVENRPGAGTTIGMAQLAKAAPDGYTIGFGNNSSHVMYPLLHQVPYDPVKDFEPISLVYRTGGVLVAYPGRVKATSLQELIAYAKANPGKLFYGSPGPNGVESLMVEMLQQRAGIKLEVVSYSGTAPLQQAFFGGQLDIAVDTPLLVATHVQTGKAVALAVFGHGRSRAFPDVPAVSELYPGFEITAWNAVMAPGGTPPDIVEKLSVEVRTSIATPEALRSMYDAGYDIGGSTPAELRDLIASDTRLLKQVTDHMTIKAE